MVRVNTDNGYSWITLQVARLASLDICRLKYFNVLWTYCHTANAIGVHNGGCVCVCHYLRRATGSQNGIINKRKNSH